MKTDVKARTWIVAGLLAVAAAASAGIDPLQNAVTGARAPIDFVRDFTAARALWHGDRRYAVDAARHNLEAARDGAPTVPEHGGPYLPHPPPATVAMLLLAPLSFNAASAVWLALTLAALVWLAANLLCAGAPENPHPPSTASVAALSAALLLWPPVLHNLEKGQWSILLAAMVAAAWRSAGCGSVPTGRAGLWIGAAASLKVMPATVLPFFIARHRRAAWTALAALVVIMAATLPLTGASPWLTFVEQSSGNVAALETWYANTASLHGLLARLFIGGPFAQPLRHAATLGRALQLASDGALLAVAVLATWRSRRTPRERPLFALWATLAVLLNPLAWAHTIVLLALPLALLVSDAEPPQRRALLAALVLLSIPKESLYRLAGPPPTEGLSAPVLSLHALGGLILFVAAVRACYRRSGTDGGGRSERSG